MDYHEGEALREELRSIARRSYRPRHSDSALIDFMERNEVSFTVNHAQATNFPYYYTMFSVVTQHIQSDTIREALDKAIEIEKP